MELRLLGPVEAEVSGRRVAIGRRQERCVLAILALEAGHPVSTDRLAELTWPDSPPKAARDVIQTYTSRLRRTLVEANGGGPAPLSRGRHGYVLDVAPALVDAHRFEALLTQARAAGTPARRSALLGTALALWRGPALADIGPDLVRDRLGARLEELRRVALDLRISADLADGRHLEILGELTGLAARSPTDERIAAHLMLALYRAGRRHDALAVYRSVRAPLRDELGLDPGAELQRLQSAMLRGEPHLQVHALGGAAMAGLPRPAQLPAMVRDYTGRREQIDMMDGLLADTADPTMAIAVITGAGGVGKTALAVWWGHRVAHRYPDGQLFVNLQCFGPRQAMRPIDALGGFLRGLGIPAEQVPVEVDEAAAMYRSRMAGCRFLVVLDNAATAEQVRPLLPGAPGCLVVVTSRDDLGALVATHGARRVTLGPLAEAEALHLLRRIIGDARVDAEPGPAAELARRCGYLPLVVRAAAARLYDYPHQTIAECVEALGDLRHAGLLCRL